MELETMKEWTRWVGKWVLIALLWAWALNQTPIGRDDTDAGAWGGGRSGMAATTDALTGCQYLRGADGGVTPRLDGKGWHMGFKP